MQNIVSTPSIPIANLIAFLGRYLNLPTATDDPSATWEKFQIDYFSHISPFAITAKSRQIGWSWLAAAEAVANGCLTPRATSIFVSLNHKEATEKIRYARQIVAALPKAVRPTLIIDSQLELEFHNGSRGGQLRIGSSPSAPPACFGNSSPKSSAPTPASSVTTSPGGASPPSAPTSPSPRASPPKC